MDDDWVVIAQHMQQVAWVPIDGAGLDLLSLETALAEQGVEAAFLPYRPGGSHSNCSCDDPTLRVRARSPRTFSAQTATCLRRSGTRVAAAIRGILCR